MSGFRGLGKRGPYFDGWYFKQQNETDTVAFIPAVHRDPGGKMEASLQVLENGNSYCFEYSEGSFRTGEGGFPFVLGKNVFSPRGCRLNACSPEFTVTGSLRYGPLFRPRNDIMGPFRFLPFLECRHRVLSLRHRVEGIVSINRKSIVFQNGIGYAEGDCGRSFPRSYVWTQGSSDRFSVMLSAAEIPLLGRRFIGCVGEVLAGEREFRIATYLGAKVLRADAEGLEVRQGGRMLRAVPLSSGGCLLKAPERGRMTRTVRENVACRVKYVCTEGGRPVFDFVGPQSSYEFSGLRIPGRRR